MTRYFATILFVLFLAPALVNAASLDGESGGTLHIFIELPDQMDTIGDPNEQEAILSFEQPGGSTETYIFLVEDPLSPEGFWGAVRGFMCGVYGVGCNDLPSNDVEIIIIPASFSTQHPPSSDSLLVRPSYYR